MSSAAPGPAGAWPREENHGPASTPDLKQLKFRVLYPNRQNWSKSVISPDTVRPASPGPRPSKARSAAAYGPAPPWTLPRRPRPEVAVRSPAGASLQSL